MSDVIGTLAAIGMAVGPPLIYVDQAYSIFKKRDSTGFSWDVCGVILIANIIRIFFWLGERFEIPLLVQSLLLIVAHLFLLSLCLHYAPFGQLSLTYNSLSPIQSPSRYQSNSPIHTSNSTSNTRKPDDEVDQLEPDSRRQNELEHQNDNHHDHDHDHETYVDEPLHRDPDSNLRGVNATRRLWGYGTKLRISNGRPFNFWQWEGMGPYLEFLAGLVVILGVLQVALGWWTVYIDALGFIALSIESTLPIPQFLSNYRRKSTYGLRASTLAGWLFGDVFKTGYFFLRQAPIQFKITAIMTVCFDLAVVGQRFYYGIDPPKGAREFEGEEESAGLSNRCDER